MPESQNAAVFVVHGRNVAVRDSMFHFLRAVGLRPMEWDAAVSLTKKTAPYIGEILDAAFSHAQAVVVLMTPDEVAYLDPRHGHGDEDTETHPSPQARPNVLFEAGMALGRNPDHTLLVEVGRVRPFSDVAGRHAIRLTNDAAARQTFVNRLKTAGCPVDTNGTDWLTTGDFNAAAPGDGLPLGRRLPANMAARKPIDIDLNFRERGGNRLSKLQVINRGTEPALNVRLHAPEDAALDLRRITQPIEKIPGGGKSVTVDVLTLRGFGGDDAKEAFDVTVTAENSAGEQHVQEVFLDLNG